MADFFHVVGYFPSNREQAVVLFLDQSRANLRRRFLRPYRRGQKITLGDGNIVALADLIRVQIIRTDKTSDAALRDLQISSRQEIDRINAESESYSLISAGYGWSTDDIIYTGEDVTAEFINSGPGHVSSVSAFFSNGWTVALGTGVILLILAILFAPPA